jgi:hypothetical protein
MSDRTCQLCGKPLSRIRVGGGEEFCSREHRTQFRLRRGMDRLQEANKVASLNRRRENPKPLNLTPVAKIVWRGYFQQLPSPERSVRLPHRTGAGKRIVGLPPAGNIALTPSGGPVQAQRRALDAGLGMHGQAGIVAPKLTVTRPCRKAEVTGDLRKLITEAVPGLTLRVSRAVGFRLRAPQAAPLEPAGPARPAMTWPGWVGETGARSGPLPERSPEAVSVPFPKPAADPQFRWKPEPERGSGMRPPEPVRVSMSVQDVVVATRSWGARWTPDDTVRLPGRGRGIDGARPMRGNRLVPLAANSAIQGAAHRISVIPFGSADITLGYSEEEQQIQ